MTARDDAANIAAQALAAGHIGLANIAAAVLDALVAHPDVLAQLAIEAGALQQVGWVEPHENSKFLWQTNTRPAAVHVTVPVFRVADRNHTKETP